MTKTLPKILEEEDKKWRELGFQIVYVGKQPGAPECDVYRTDDFGKDRITGYPTVYIVRDNEYNKIRGEDALLILQNVPDKKSETREWKYVGKYPEKFGDYSDVDVYVKNSDPTTETGFPTVYIVKDEKVIFENTGLESLKILRDVRKSTGQH